MHSCMHASLDMRTSILLPRVQFIVKHSCLHAFISHAYLLRDTFTLHACILSSYLHGYIRVYTLRVQYRARHTSIMYAPIRSYCMHTSTPHACTQRHSHTHTAPVHTFILHAYICTRGMPTSLGLLASIPPARMRMCICIHGCIDLSCMRAYIHRHAHIHTACLHTLTLHSRIHPCNMHAVILRHAYINTA